MRRYYVHAWGWWFCMARGWVPEPLQAVPLGRRAAEVVRDEQPGVVLVSASA